MMSQLGNLAIICAKRENVLFQILDGIVTVYVFDDPDGGKMFADWKDDEAINEIACELNFGKYAEKIKKGAAA